MTYFRGSSSITAIATSIAAATSGCSSISAAPPPKRMFRGSIGYCCPQGVFPLDEGQSSPPLQPVKCKGGVETDKET